MNKTKPRNIIFNRSSLEVFHPFGDTIKVRFARLWIDSLTLSCHGFVDNQVRLQLFALAYNLGNFLRQAVLPQSVHHCTLTTLLEKLIKIGAKVMRHSRRIIFQMAEVAESRALFRTTLQVIGCLRLPAEATAQIKALVNISQEG